MLDIFFNFVNKVNKVNKGWLCFFKENFIVVERKKVCYLLDFFVLILIENVYLIIFSLKKIRD